MGKLIDDSVLDAALAELATADVMVCCDTQPANHAALAGVNLAEVAMTPGLGNGDFTAADDTSGRKVTMTAKLAIDVDVSGDIDHIALDDGTTLLAVTTCSSQAVLDTEQVNVPAWTAAIADPT
jgi:hypothetical protein